MEVRTESVAQIIKNHYGIKSEASKYNIAALGADRESLERSKAKILNTADKLIDQIDSELNKKLAESKLRNYIHKLIIERFNK